VLTSGANRRGEERLVTVVRVLVIDDEPLIADLVCTVLEDEGYDLTCFCSADAALHEIETRDNFDAVITDIDLGGSIDGFELARRARFHRPDAAVIYISGAAAARVASERVPGAQFLGKPFRPYRLAEILRSALPAATDG
jgi:DNA-binding NtrC family response regulator